MPLKLTLKPHERIVINGCAIRNSERRQVLIVESQADVVRGKDLLEPEVAATPVSKVYYLVQTVLINSETREKLLPVIQQNLGVLATVFGSSTVSHIFEAANFVSQGDYYKALSELRPVLRHEEEVLKSASRRAASARKAHVGHNS